MRRRRVAKVRSGEVRIPRQARYRAPARTRRELPKYAHFGHPSKRSKELASGLLNVLNGTEVDVFRGPSNLSRVLRGAEVSVFGPRRARSCAR